MGRVAVTCINKFATSPHDYPSHNSYHLVCFGNFITLFVFGNLHASKFRKLIFILFQLQSKIVMKEHKTKSRSPSIPKGKSTRRLSPLSDGDSGQQYPPRLTPERYRGAYERRPVPEDMKKSKAAHPGGDAAWHDPWMRPNSPKDRKRQLSRSSSSSDSSSNESDSSQHKRLQELKRHIANDLANRRRKAKKDAAKLKRLKEKLSPSEFELLTRKRVKRYSDTASKSKHDSNSDSDSDDSSSSRLLLFFQNSLTFL